MAELPEEVVIAGAAEVPYTRRPPATIRTAELLGDAVRAALASAGLEHQDVDGLGISSFTLQPDHCADLAWQLGLKLSWSMEDTNGGGSALNLLQHAIRAIEAGDAETIVLATGGVARASAFAELLASFNAATRDHLAPLPYHGPNSLFALLTRRHMRQHGLTREHYAQVAVAQRRFATLNPGAVYREPMTVEDYLRAPLVTDPLCIYDCVPGVTGADGVVVTSRERARSHAVGVRAIRCTFNHAAQEGDGLRTGLVGVSPDLWSEAGLGPDAVDVACVYDDYPVMVLVQLADLGFVPGGDVERLIRTRIVESRPPVNTSGGMLSAGQARGSGGMHGLVEAVVQLRGEAGERQVESCRYALVTGYGMVLYRHGSCACAAILERLE